MAYNEFGIYEPSDESSLDQMRLALTKQPSLVSQIPGNTGSDAQAPKPDRPLDRAELNFKSIAASLNPLMMMKTMRDAVNTAIVNPLLTPASIAVEALQGKKITGSALAQQPVTPVGQMFEESLFKAADVAKVPHMGLLARPAGRRPVLTPNDVRVMGAEATRVARGIKDIPADFANAQSGLTRVDPVTNQPTYGAKLQGVAESIGDVMAQREMQGLTPIPGLPAEVQPQTKMYAVRPSGSTIAMPQFPATTRSENMPKNTAAYRMLNDVVDEKTTTLSPDALLRQWYARRVDANVDATPFRQYAATRALELYPDAPSGDRALAAVQARYSDNADYAVVELGWLNDFMQTPEGQASDLSRVPAPAELQARHEAATQWLYGPLLNYTRKHVGSVGDPLVKLASQGITYIPPSRLEETADYEISASELEARRAKSNLPAQGMVRPALDAKQAELTQAQEALQVLQQQREGYRDIALQQGLTDPAQLPEYARTTRPIAQATSAVNKLQEEYDNLKVGALYENVSDWAVTPRTRESVLSDLDYSQQQFYPSVTRARPDDIIYNMGSQSRLRDIGLQDIARDFYNDVMSGKIPVEQVSKLSVDKYVRDKTMPRIAKEKEAAKKQLTFKTDAENVMRNTMLQNTAPGDYFGNTAVVELSQKTGLNADQFTRILSEATTVLDHCIGQGGSAGGGEKNPWKTGSTRTYIPAYNIATGELDSRAGRQTTSYANEIERGEKKIADIRDSTTGLPVATLEFTKASYGPDAPLYNVGFVSGFKNGDVQPEYRDGVIAYLNSRAGEIRSAGDNLGHIGVIDVKNSSARDLATFTGKYADDIRAADLSQLPRFATKAQVLATIEAPPPVAAPAAPAAPAASTELSLAHDRNLATILTDTRTSIEAAINNAADYATNAHNDDHVGNAVSGILRGRMAEFLDGVPIEDVPAALRNLQTTVMNDEFQFSNSNRTFNNSISDGIIEFITDLEGIIDYHDRRLREVAATPAPPPAIVSMALQDIVRNGLDANDYATVYNIPLDAVEEMLARLRDPDMTMVNLRAMRDNALGRAQGTFFAGLTDAQAENAAQLLTVIIGDTERSTATDPLAAWAQGFEPDDVPANLPAPAPAQAPAIDYVGMIDRVTNDMAVNYGMTETERVNTVAYRVAENVNPRLDPAGYAVALREAADREPLESVELALYDLADQVETAIAGGQPAPAPAQVNDTTQMTRQQLVERIEPDRWPLINALSDLATAMARREPDPTGFVVALREGQFPNITDGLNPYERESIAQDVRDSLQVQGAFAPAPAQAPAPAPANIAPRSVVPAAFGNMTSAALEHALLPTDLAAVARLNDVITDVNDRDDLPRIVDLIRNHRMGEWENFDFPQRELLARLIGEHYDDAGRALGTPVAAQLREDAESIAGILDEAYLAEVGDEDVALQLLQGYIRDLDVITLENLLGMAGDDYDITPQLVRAVQQELQQYLGDYGGRANGGTVRGYRSGGLVAKRGIVKQNPSVEQMRFELMMRGK